jgi:CRISPR-associated protein Csb1
MTKEITFDLLHEAVTGTGVAFRSCVKLQPAGGDGTKVFPPTYAGAVYATEKRRLPESKEPVECVLLDSVQSQANRMEDALQQAVDAGVIAIPVVEVDFTPFFPGEDQPPEKRLLDPVGKVTSLQAPHRIADAILRDSTLDGVVFRESPIGKRINMASARDATALFEYCPTALCLGLWDSTGPKGGLGVKFERAVVAEIVGIGAVYGVKTSSRIDPLGIRRDAGPLYRAEGGVGWTVVESHAVKGEKGKVAMLGDDGRPSEANHGNVTPSFGKYSKGAEGRDPLAEASVDLTWGVQQGDDRFNFSARARDANRDAREGRIAPGGVTVSRAEQTVVLSLPALRRLRFPLDGVHDPGRDAAARTVLAALALCGATLAAETGLDLRSRCLLWPVAALEWALLGKPGEIQDGLTLSGEQAVVLLAEAIQRAKKHGLKWNGTPVVLTPSDALVKLVVKSQQNAVRQGSKADEGGD